MLAAGLIKAVWQGNFPCLFHMMTGAYCPGCGGTRAVKSLLKGEILLSVIYHPLVLYSVIAGPLLLLWYVYCRTTDKPFRQICWKAALVGGAVLMGGNFVVKNGLLFWGVDVLAVLDQG